MRKQVGTVYVLEITLGKDVVYKVGVTGRKRLATRVGEIVIDHYLKVGYFPKVRVLKEEKTVYYYEVESYLHKKLTRYYYEHEFNGCTELFTDLDEVMRWYRLVMDHPMEYIKVDVCRPETVEDVSLNDIVPELIDY